MLNFFSGRGFHYIAHEIREDRTSELPSATAARFGVTGLSFNFRLERV